MARTFIIAEAGVNHNGDVEMAKALVKVAAEAGVDAVKFQTWKTELLVAEGAKVAEYQEGALQQGESQFELLKRLELSYDQFADLHRYCQQVGVQFLSTPDEEQSAEFLNGLQSVFKIGSGELTNIPFLRYVASFGKPVILSTGMGTLGEVEAGLDALLEAGLTKEQVTLLHATTDYPTHPRDVNLRAMRTLQTAFPGVAVGYSDHTLGIEVSLAAVALGATVLEKHFTLDRTLPGPDHQASLTPSQLTMLVEAVRNVEMALGTGWKKPAGAEIENRAIVRKSLHAACDIIRGQTIEDSMVVAKRPGTGKSPARYDEIVGSVATRDIRSGELL